MACWNDESEVNMIASMLAPLNESRKISAQFALTVRSYQFAYSDEVRMHPGITRAF